MDMAEKKKAKITYMLRTKPKYQFPLTEEEKDELNYYVAKIYNPLIEDFQGVEKTDGEKASA
jgi:hypothetical protein